MAIVKQLDSLDQAIKFIRATVPGVAESTYSFYCGTLTENVARVHRGASYAEQLESIDLVKRTTATFKGRKRPEWTPSVAGPRVCVPAYLTGHPLNVRRRINVPSSRAPLRIVVETLVSAKSTDLEIRKRGAAIAALVAKLSETRPVELYAAWGARILRTDIVGMMKLESTPVALSYLCAVLNDAHFSRGIVLRTVKAQYTEARGSTNYGAGIKWAWNERPDSPSRITKMRDLLGMAPQDIFIPGGHAADAYQMQHDPLAWVNERVASQRDV